MSEYQRIEYLIGKDGKVTERVLNASGNECINATSGVEAALGKVENRELLPEYYETADHFVEETQYNTDHS